MDSITDVVARHLAAACCRSSLHPDGLRVLQEAFSECLVLRMSFGLTNKVMLSVTVSLVDGAGDIHASYVPIHPTAAAASVLQNKAVVVLRQEDKKPSPLWDQEDLFQREQCAVLAVISMPFYWPPRPAPADEWGGPGGVGDVGVGGGGAPLAVPQNTAHHPTFGALTAAGTGLLTYKTMTALEDVAARTGRFVAPYISQLLASMEAEGMMPTEEVARLQMEEMLPYGDRSGGGGAAVAGGAGSDEDSGLDVYGFDFAQLQAEVTPDMLERLRLTSEEAAEASLPRAGAAAAPQPQLLPLAPASTGGALVAEQQQQSQLGSGPAAATTTATAAAAGAEEDLETTDSSASCQSRLPVDIPTSFEALPAAAAAAAATAAATAAAAAAAVVACALPPPPPPPDERVQLQLGLVQATMAVHRPVPLGPLASAKPVHFNWHSLSFQRPQLQQLEQRYADHWNRQHQKTDLAALLAVLLMLLAASVAQVPDTAWASGVAAVLPFAPFLFDSRLYWAWREPLLAGMSLLLSPFLASIALPSARDVAAALQPLAGVGLWAFAVHTCGLGFLMAAPLLLRLRSRRSAAVQGVNLVMALSRLPGAYSGVMGRVRISHAALMGLLLVAGALASQGLAQWLERRHRRAWLARLKRLEGVEAVPLGLSASSSSSSSSSSSTAAATSYTMLPKRSGASPLAAPMVRSRYGSMPNLRR